MTAVELVSRIQASIRADACRGRDSERIGPFLATFNRDDANPFLNYAFPDEDAGPAPEEVRALIAAYRTRTRRPRLEYIGSLAPSVEPVLLREGFEVEGRLPLMTCMRPSDVHTRTVDGVELVAPSSEEEFHGAASVQWEAYEELGDVPQRVADALRQTAAAGGVVVLARDARTNEPAGAGLCTAPHDGLTELTSIAVRSTHRRRGIAAAMTGWLAREAFARGVSGVFLMARGDAEARIYSRTGFAFHSEALHISRS